MGNLKTLDLLSRRLWKCQLDKNIVFSFTKEEQAAFNIDIIHYFQNCCEIIRIDFEFNKSFTSADLITYLQNVESMPYHERYNRVLVAYCEIFDEEFRLFADLLITMETDLSKCLDELQSWLLLRIWNSQNNFYDPKTDLIIEKYLGNNGEFKDYLASICCRGIYNPAFCRWIINHWTDCSCYHFKLKPLLEQIEFPLSEQTELLTKIKALD